MSTLDRRIENREAAMNERAEIVLLRHELEELRVEVRELKNGVSDLVSAWQTANNLVRFMKWLSGISVSAAILYELVKHRI